METSELYRDDHLAATLGRFRFAEHSPIVYTGAHEDRVHVPFTMFHEQTHQTLAVSTPYGVLQAVLGLITGERPRPGLPDWVAAASSLLAHSIRQSWAAHEGYAVHSEYVLAEAGGVPRPPTRLPPEYQRAYGLYARLTSALPDEYEPFEPLIAKAAAFVALGSPILECWDHRTGSAQDLAVLLSSEEHAPDRRLLRLADCFNLPASGADALHTAYRDLAPAHGLPTSVPVYDAVRLAVTGRYPELHEALFWSVARVVDRAVPVCCPGLDFVPVAESEERALLFLRAVRMQLSPLGIAFPEPVSAAEARPTELARTQFRPRPLPPVELVAAEHAAEVLDSPSMRGASFLVYLFFRPVREGWPDGGDAGESDATPASESPGCRPGMFFAQLLEHREVPVDGVEAGQRAFATRLDAPRLILGGSWPHVRKALAGLGERLLASAIHLDLADLAASAVWEPATELARESGAELVVVAPGTAGEELKARLAVLRDAGLSDLEIAADDGIVRVLAATTEKGLTVLFPVAAPALIALEEEQRDLAHWMVDVLEAMAERPDRKQTALDVQGQRAWALMLLLGLFDVAP